MKIGRIRVFVAVVALVGAILFGIVGMAPRRVSANAPACECTFMGHDGLKKDDWCVEWNCIWITE